MCSKMIAIGVCIVYFLKVTAIGNNFRRCMHGADTSEDRTTETALLREDPTISCNHAHNTNMVVECDEFIRVVYRSTN